MKNAHPRNSLSNIHSETQKLRRQNANVLRSRSVCYLLSHMIIEFPNSRHMYALSTYFSHCWTSIKLAANSATKTSMLLTFLLLSNIAHKIREKLFPQVKRPSYGKLKFAISRWQASKSWQTRAFTRQTFTRPHTAVFSRKSTPLHWLISAFKIS